MEYCINERSLDKKAKNAFEAIDAMETIIEIVKKSWEVDRAKVTIRTEKGFLNLEIADNLNLDVADGFNMRRWLNKIDKERKNLILAINDRSPYIDIAMEEEARERELTIEAKYKGLEAKGLLASYLLGNFSLSFPFDDDFSKNEIQIDIEELSNTETENCDDVEINSFPVGVKNVFDISSLKYHETEYKSMSNCIIQIADMESLLKKGDQVFPSIEFGTKAFDEMKREQISANRFQKIVEKLYLLNRFFQIDVSAGNRDLKTIPNCSSESEATKNQFSQERIFMFADGTEYFCEWHLKLTSMNWRIHFAPDFEKKKAFVGYIGEHLRTSRYH